MALHETAVTIRRSVIFGAIGLVALVILISSFNSLRAWWYRLHPPPDPSPTTGFGKLPSLQLPALSIKGTPTYSLETATGALPSFSDRAEVVAVEELTPSLLGEQKAKSLAERLGFTDEGELSENKETIVFRDDGDKRTLAINLTTQHFVLITDPSHTEGTIPEGRALSSAEAIEEVKGFLSRNGLLKGEFGTGTQTTQVHRIVDGEIKDAPSISEGQFTRVDFFRTLTGVSSDSFPILPPNPKVGLIQTWVTSGLDPEINNILAASYTVWELDKERVETYPLRPVSSAWEEVQNGSGIAEVLVEGSSPLDNYTPQTLQSISIRSVYLAYFDDSSFQKYLQPIYVFSGSAKTTDGREADFTAYRPAISDEWVQE